MKNFKELKIWQKGMSIAVNSYKLVADFPREEKFTITSQITRAAVSIPSNIAEAVNFGNQELRKQLLSEIDEEQKMIMSFISKLNR